MFTWVKKKIVGYAVGVIKDKLIIYEQKQPDLAEFHKNLYELSLPKFMEYAIEKLAKQDLDNTTFIDQIKKLLIPLDDKVENLVIKALDDLKLKE
jgi:hypothetical protein